jgi:cytoskeletal protein RodZ
MFRELGERLRSYRVDAGVEIEDLSARTRIAARNIQALEQGDVDLLPGQAFVKGFIRAICAELDRDPEPILELYNQKIEELSAEEENGAPDNRKTFPLILSVGVLIVLIVGGFLLHGGTQKDPEQAGGDEATVSISSAINPTEEASFASTVQEAPRELDLVIRAIERTWLRIQADSSQPWETTLKTGDEIRLKAMDRIRLFIGNAGGILFELNGKRFGPPGSQGQVISDYVITRDNL